MKKAIFGVDEIHAVRLELAERRAKMTPEEARSDITAQAEQEQQAIEAMRNLSPEEVEALQAACAAAYAEQLKNVE